MLPDHPALILSIAAAVIYLWLTILNPFIFAADFLPPENARPVNRTAVRLDITPATRGHWVEILPAPVQP